MEGTGGKKSKVKNEEKKSATFAGFRETFSFRSLYLSCYRLMSDPAIWQLSAQWLLQLKNMLKNIKRIRSCLNASKLTC